MKYVRLLHHVHRQNVGSNFFLNFAYAPSKISFTPPSNQNPGSAPELYILAMMSCVKVLRWRYPAFTAV